MCKSNVCAGGNSTCKSAACGRINEAPLTDICHEVHVTENLVLGAEYRSERMLGDKTFAERFAKTPVKGNELAAA